jgi:hypothetical protein
MATKPSAKGGRQPSQLNIFQEIPVAAINDAACYLQLMTIIIISSSCF